MEQSGRYLDYHLGDAVSIDSMVNLLDADAAFRNTDIVAEKPGGQRTDVVIDGQRVEEQTSS